MFQATWKAVVFGLTVSACAVSGLVTGGTLADGKPIIKDDLGWVEKRVQELQPTKAERRFDDIAWAGGLVEAKALAKKHGRPLVLFVHDGPSLATLRC